MLVRGDNRIEKVDVVETTESTEEITHEYLSRKLEPLEQGENFRQLAHWPGIFHVLVACNLSRESYLTVLWMSIESR